MMLYEVCVKKKEYLCSPRKTGRGEIIILAECIDKETADYICALFAEKGICAFVVSFDEHIKIQGRYSMKRGSIKGVN